MGTSLSGLTPATTFDGLLKVGDNDPLTAELKAISTGDGTDTILRLSNSALSIGGNVEIDSSGLNALIVKRNGTELLKSDGSGLNGGIIFTGNLGNLFSVGVKGNDFNIWDGSYLGGGDLRFSILADGKTAIGAQTPTAQLHVKGSGNDDTTTALLVQNSDGADMLKVGDNGFTNFISKDASNHYLQVTTANTYNGFKFVGGANSREWRTYGGQGTWFSDSLALSTGFQLPTARLHVKGEAPSGDPLNNPTALLVQNSAGTDLLKVTDDGITNVRSSFIVNHPSVSSRSLKLGWGSIYAGDNSAELSIGAVYSSNTAPRIILGGTTRESGADAIQVQTLNGMYIAPAAGTKSPDAQLQVKGSGNDATTTALLVQNSDGTTLFSVKDSGWVDINPTNSSDGSFKVRGDGADNLLFVNANDNYVGIGGTQSSSAVRAYIKGKGNDNTTTALLVQNSTGTEHFKTTDDGVTAITSASQSVPLYVNASGSATAGIEIRSTSARRFRILATSTITTLEATNTGGISTNASLSVGSGYTPANASAVLQADSTTQGFLPPRMTDAERDAITNPAAGLMIYDTSNNQMNYWNGSTWIAF